MAWNRHERLGSCGYHSLMIAMDTPCLPTHHPRSQPPSPSSPTPTPTRCDQSTRGTCSPTSPPSPTPDRPVVDRTRDRAHGRVELRTLKAVSVRHFGFPHAAQILQVTRKSRDLRTRRWRTVTVSTITSLTFAQASPALLADLLRGH